MEKNDKLLIGTICEEDPEQIFLQNSVKEWVDNKITYKELMARYSRHGRRHFGYGFYLIELISDFFQKIDFKEWLKKIRRNNNKSLSK